MSEIEHDDTFIIDNDANVESKAILELVQRRRIAMLKGKTGGLDGEEMKLLTQLAKTAIDESRIAVDSEGAKAEAELARSMAAMMARMEGNPFQRQVDREVKAPELDLPPLDDVLDGELSTEQSTLDYSEFNKHKTS